MVMWDGQMVPVRSVSLLKRLKTRQERVQMRARNGVPNLNLPWDWLYERERSHQVYCCEETSSSDENSTEYLFQMTPLGDESNVFSGIASLNSASPDYEGFQPSTLNKELYNKMEKSIPVTPSSVSQSGERFTPLSHTCSSRTSDETEQITSLHLNPSSAIYNWDELQKSKASRPKKPWVKPMLLCAPPLPKCLLTQNDKQSPKRPPLPETMEITEINESSLQSTPSHELQSKEILAPLNHSSSSGTTTSAETEQIKPDHLNPYPTIYKWDELPKSKASHKKPWDKAMLLSAPPLPKCLLNENDKQPIKESPLSEAMAITGINGSPFLHGTTSRESSDSSTSPEHAFLSGSCGSIGVAKQSSECSVGRPKSPLINSTAISPTCDKLCLVQTPRSHESVTPHSEPITESGRNPAVDIHDWTQSKHCGHSDSSDTEINLTLVESHNQHDCTNVNPALSNSACGDGRTPAVAPHLYLPQAPPKAANSIPYAPHTMAAPAFRRASHFVKPIPGPPHTKAAPTFRRASRVAEPLFRPKTIVGDPKQSNGVMQRLVLLPRNIVERNIVEKHRQLPKR